jgi:hypothetical protein
MAPDSDHARKDPHPSQLDRFVHSAAAMHGMGFIPHRSVRRA